MNANGRAPEGGFSLLELVFVILIIGVVSSLAVMGIASSRERVRLGDAAQEMTGQLEKARLDAVRRHAEPGAESSVRVVDDTTYRLTMDFDGDGALEEEEFRDIQLPDGVTFQTEPTPLAAEFDSAGRIESDISFTGRNRTGSFTIRLSASGNISRGAAPAAPAVAGTPYRIPTPTPTPSPAATPAPPAGTGGCDLQLTPDSTPFTIRKNGKTVGYVTAYLNAYGNPGEVTASWDTNDLSVSPASAVVSPGGSAVFAISDIKKAQSNKYTTPITFNSPCGAKQVPLEVSP